jgi:hypothetical protein
MVVSLKDHIERIFVRSNSSFNLAVFTLATTGTVLIGLDPVLDTFSLIPTDTLIKAV